MESALKDLIGQGVLGVIVVVLFYWVWQKDKAIEKLRDDHADALKLLNEKHGETVRTEMTARITDSSNFTGLALKLQSEQNTQVNRLTDVFDEMKRLAPVLMPARHYEDEREEARRRPTLQAPRDRSRVPEERQETTAQMRPGGGRYGG